MLTYSNWETATICFSESFESLSEGLQNALWELGGVPERHRTDRMGLAVNNLSDQKEFTQRYQSLMAHCGLTMEKIKANQATRTATSSRATIASSKRWIRRSELRGTANSQIAKATIGSCGELLDQRNAARRNRLAEERAVLRPLPAGVWRATSGGRRVFVEGALIHVDRNVYSVHSRLIGEWVEVRLYAEELEVWYGEQVVEQIPRLRGQQKHHVNYRHVIDWLVRKPGASRITATARRCFRRVVFAWPTTSCVRLSPASASREYLADPASWRPERTSRR